MRKNKSKKNIPSNVLCSFLLTPSSSSSAAQNLFPFTLTGTNMNPHPSQAVLALFPITLQARHQPSRPEMAIAGFLMALTCQRYGQEGSAKVTTKNQEVLVGKMGQFYFLPSAIKDKC